MEPPDLGCLRPIGRLATGGGFPPFASAADMCSIREFCRSSGRSSRIGTGGSDVAGGELVSDCRLFSPHRLPDRLWEFFSTRGTPDLGCLRPVCCLATGGGFPPFAGTADMCSIREFCRSSGRSSRICVVVCASAQRRIATRRARHVVNSSLVGARRCRLLASPRARPARATPLLPRAVRLA